MLYDFTDESLRRYMPVTFKPLEGEASLLDRLSPFIERERLAVDRVIGEDVPDPLKESRDFRECWLEAVSALALHAAIPMLDIVLTPDGFATVGNSSVVPASAQRTKSLSEFCERRAAGALNALVLKASKNEEWRASPPGRLECECICPGLSFSDFGKRIWNVSDHARMRALVMRHQRFLANEYLSQPLMSAFALEAHVIPMGAMGGSIQRRSLVERIQGVIARMCDKEYEDALYMTDLAYEVYLNPSVFPEFVGTPQYEMIRNPQSYENEKGSAGYFF